MKDETTINHTISLVMFHFNQLNAIYLRARSEILNFLQRILTSVNKKKTNRSPAGLLYLLNELG